MKDRLLFNNDMNNFLETNLKKKYDKITFIIKCNVIFNNICYTIFVVFSPIMEIKGFSL